jgi:Electron transfer DM13
MKNIFALLVIFLVLSCQPEDAVPTTPVTDNPDLTGATLLKEGMFTGIGGHTVSGTVKAYELAGKKYLVFDPYSSQNGPDLKVYLSKNENATEYISLGKLMSTTGKQTYTVPNGTDLAQYPYVHIWCEQFSVEFARTQLQ